jgi:hypothetical protein
MRGSLTAGDELSVGKRAAPPSPNCTLDSGRRMPVSRNARVSVAREIDVLAALEHDGTHAAAREMPRGEQARGTETDDDGTSVAVDFRRRSLASGEGAGSPRRIAYRENTKCTSALVARVDERLSMRTKRRSSVGRAFFRAGGAKRYVGVVKWKRNVREQCHLSKNLGGISRLLRIP